MNLNSSYFILFANCIPVKGATRSTICDLQRNKFLYIPNELYQILTEYNHLSIQEIKVKYNNKYDNIIDEYFQFLLNKKLITLCDKDDLSNFPILNLELEESLLITNAVLEVQQDNTKDKNRIIQQLDKIICKNLQIKITSNVESKYLTELLECLNETTIKYVECIVPDNSSFSEKLFLDLFKTYPRLYNLYVYNKSEFKIIPFKDAGNIIYVNKDLSNRNTCGFIHPNHFSVNMDFFIESKVKNSCLNKKVAIDKDGYIKNCLAMDVTYGNIYTDDLEEVVKRKDFQQLWNITKDNILVCKDCEFRYICPDCRAIIENKDNIFSKPLHCNYDPYTAKYL
ncbi:MAG: grasp-with-spasm system SPASM domain peptide maturase [Candidatus Izemoplasmatales bacterium]